MAQVTIYLSEATLADVRRRASKENKSLSAFISDCLTRETTQDQWPRSLVDLLSSPGDDLAEPEDPPPEDVDI